MSTDIEKNKDEISESTAEKVKALFEQIASAGDAPEGLLDVLKKMSDDPDLAELLQSHEDDEAKKEEIALRYAEQIQEFFSTKGWHYTSMDPTGKIMVLGFRMRNSTVRLEVIVEARAECVRFNTSLLTCQAEYRLAMSQYISELNMPLRYGAFHLDMNDGEVTYRYSTSFKGIPFSAESFENYVDACIITADSNYKELGKIANGRFDDNEKKEWFKKIKEFAIALSK